jgi:hypothetical protein
MDTITIDQKVIPLLLRLPSHHVWIDYDEGECSLFELRPAVSGRGGPRSEPHRTHRLRPLLRISWYADYRQGAYPRDQPKGRGLPLRAGVSCIVCIGTIIVPVTYSRLSMSQAIDSC